MSERITTFSDRLKIGMKEKGFKAVDLAKRSGVSESIISNYRAGRFKASQDNTQKLAEALNVSISWLMGFDVPMGSYEFNGTVEIEPILTKLKKLSPSQLSVVEDLIDALIN